MLFTPSRFPSRDCFRAMKVSEEAEEPGAPPGTHASSGARVFRCPPSLTAFACHVPAHVVLVCVGVLCPVTNGIA